MEVNFCVGTFGLVHKVAPLLSDLHCILEAHLEDGPVCTIGLKMRNVG